MRAGWKVPIVPGACRQQIPAGLSEELPDFWNSLTLTYFFGFALRSATSARNWANTGHSPAKARQRSLCARAILGMYSRRPTVSTWRTTRRWLVRGTVALLTVALWSAASLPSGFAVQELLMFAAPGAVLAIAASWMSRAFSRGTWGWADGAKAALRGALFLPPVIAFGIAFLAALNRAAIVVIFVFGAWLALGCGLAAALIRDLTSASGARPQARDPSSVGPGGAPSVNRCRRVCRLGHSRRAIQCRRCPVGGIRA